MWQIQWLLQLIPDSVFVWITYALFLTGVVLYIASKLVTIIPMINRYKIAAELAGVVTLIVAAYFYGGVEYRQMIADLKARVAVAEQQSKDANSALEKKTREKVQVIKETVYVNKTIIKETAGRQIDSQCVLPRSAVSLHNSASSNQVSRGAESADGTPSTVKASELLETVVDNYGACHENAEKLRGWQEWYSTQKKIFDAVTKQ
jgi:hypothetical protein